MKAETIGTTPRPLSGRSLAGFTAPAYELLRLIETAGGKSLKVDRWGKRRMAYPIKKRHDGVYVFIQAEMPPQAGATLERNLRLTEQVLRFLLTAQDQA